LIGTMISYLLFGIVIVQVYFYYTSFPNDKTLIKVSVYSLFLMDIFQTIAISSTAWSFLCAGWGRPENLHLTDWGFGLIPMFCGVCSAAVQMFFSWRIYSLGMKMPQKKMFWIAIVFIICVSLAQGIASVVTTIQVRTMTELYEMILTPSSRWQWYFVWLAGSAISDILITFCMGYLLSSARAKSRQTHFHGQARPTEAALSRLIRISIETGAITSGAAILDLIFFLHFSNNSLHLLVAFILSKLYTNTFYASLNARISLRKDADKNSNAGVHNSITRSEEIVDTCPSHSLNIRQMFSPSNVFSLNQHIDQSMINKVCSRLQSMARLLMPKQNLNGRCLDDEQNVIPMVSIVKETFSV
ncbi:hypothetical protein K435DRAFT_655786, partial [Dendrothele bispora CBS 962.96]